jgi:hypothetical protein
MAYRRLKPLASAALMVSAAVGSENRLRETHHDALAGRDAGKPRHQRIVG